jgi:hypothetical protein
MENCGICERDFICKINTIFFSKKSCNAAIKIFSIIIIIINKILIIIIIMRYFNFGTHLEDPRVLQPFQQYLQSLPPLESIGW